MADFKPSQVVLRASPLIGTMGRAETESAAALVVHACKRHGDKWQAVTTDMVVGAIRVAGPDSPLGMLIRNPFLKPDFIALVAGGFATRSDDDGVVSYELTAKGLAALQRWVWPEEEAGRG